MVSESFNPKLWRLTFDCRSSETVCETQFVSDHQRLIYQRVLNINRGISCRSISLCHKLIRGGWKIKSVARPNLFTLIWFPFCRGCDESVGKHHPMTVMIIIIIISTVHNSKPNYPQSVHISGDFPFPPTIQCRKYRFRREFQIDKIGQVW